MSRQNNVLLYAPVMAAGASITTAVPLLSYSLAILMLGVLILASYRSDRSFFSASVPSIGLLLALFISLFSGLFEEKGYGSRPGAEIYQFAGILIFFTSVHLGPNLFNKETADKVVRYLFLAMCISLIIGLLYGKSDFWLGLSDARNQILPLFMTLLVFSSFGTKNHFIIVTLLVTFISLFMQAQASLLGLFLASAFYIFRWNYVVSIILAFAVLLMTVIADNLYGWELQFSNLITSAFNLINQSSEGGLLARYNLVIHSLQPMIDSYFIGYGAGAFSGQSAPLQNQEAHNSLFDQTLQYGLLSSFLIFNILFFGLCASIMKANLRLLFSIIFLLVIMSFHNLTRHPSFWMCLAACYFCTSDQKIHHVPKKTEAK